MIPAATVALSRAQVVAGTWRTVPGAVTRNVAGSDTWTDVSTGLYRFTPPGPRTVAYLDTDAPEIAPHWSIALPAGTDVQPADRIAARDGSGRRWDVVQGNARLGPEVERVVDADEVLG